MNRSAYWIDYQERALEFHVGDVVAPTGGADAIAGRVVEVYPAIGMVDVEWPSGAERVPVEELQILNPDKVTAVPPNTDNRPVTNVHHPRGPSAGRVANAYMKKAIYWAAKDRKYRATKKEIEEKIYICPRCKASPLRKANYKRAEGQSVSLMACGNCLFIIRTCDLFGHHQNCDDQPEVF